MIGTEAGSSMYATIPKLDGVDRDESAHLDALRLYGVLDSPPKVSFDDLANP
ncbi:MAG TPA: hypothetical protein VFO14_11630 [Vicinamibacterales bacterium]|nr:hypothetical protein [Vicinamibacterales bacterium]